VARQVEGFRVGATGSPAEGEDAGPSADLLKSSWVANSRHYRSTALRELSRAKKLLGHNPAGSGRAVDLALHSAAKSFWWAEDTELEGESHALMHRIGKWRRKELGCWLDYGAGRYRQVCPIAIAHKRIGFSIGFIAKRHCSICGEDLSECPHDRSRSYWVPGGAGTTGRCRVCRATDCGHAADYLYRAPVISVVTELELREISVVGRPAQPEARLTELPIDLQDLGESLGPNFAPGVPVSCDKCLHQCEGIDDPYGVAGSRLSGLQTDS
jgi:hypothetical protein